MADGTDSRSPESSVESRAALDSASSNASIEGNISARAENFGKSATTNDAVNSLPSTSDVFDMRDKNTSDAFSGLNTHKRDNNNPESSESSVKPSVNSTSRSTMYQMLENQRKRQGGSHFEIEDVLKNFQ